MPTTGAIESEADLSCSFCGKSRGDVDKLIAGPGVYICNECVALCDDILAEELATPLRNWEEMPDEKLFSEMVRVHGSHSRVDQSVGDIVRCLRGRGVSWARIGEALGMTRQSAWERFSGEE